MQQEEVRNLTLLCEDRSSKYCLTVVFADTVQDKVYAAWQLGVRALLCQRGGFLSENSFFSQVAAQLGTYVLSDGMTFKR